MGEDRTYMYCNDNSLKLFLDSFSATPRCRNLTRHKPVAKQATMGSKTYYTKL